MDNVVHIDRIRQRCPATDIQEALGDACEDLLDMGRRGELQGLYMLAVDTEGHIISLNSGFDHHSLGQLVQHSSPCACEKHS